MTIARLTSFVRDESGATAIEYALLCFLIALPIILAVTSIGTKLQNSFNEVASNLK
jgi:pilus assembly protein Flp/PilA